ncbi:AraC family transcriptional regulator [Fulvivirga sediminis]|uniref:Helix-turn-helix domain-containing protein n=1 Tax=Fulvivirga sediminis TaxID=2803949 RepID=A0A937JZQ3_9BACT|nr:AraC family transcriptional regulator [Fulvivirga sediminis]MBL3655525.1 helix-turn-helix domain-containing protein [Fulvivirga sediminis]
MQKQSLHQPYEIEYVTMEESSAVGHKNTFFELVYVLSGSGKQCINNSKFKYFENHMFLITPNDCHQFEIEKPTTFFFLRFNDIYIQSSGLQASNIEKIEFMLQNAGKQPGCILRNQTDKLLVRPMVEALVREYMNQDLYNTELTQQMINTLIVVVTRNIAKFLPDNITEYSEEKILDILHYIQQNIYEPEKIRAKTISGVFGISESYLGRYFKKHTSETMQQYINHYRLKLIEHRLRHSNLRINEIAFSMGFTDESHLNKFFRKNRGMSPVAFRKEMREVVV